MGLDLDVAITGDGSKIAWTTIGDGQPAILLLSWSTSMHLQLESPQSAPFYTELMSRLRVTAYDRRGVGASSHDVPSVSIEDQLTDLALVMDATGLAASDLIADNDASYVAVRFAARWPDRVRRMALWSPLVGAQDARAEEMREFAELMRSDYETACYRWAKSSARGAGEADWRTAAQLLASQRSGAVTADYLDWEVAEDVSEVLPTVVAPTLVLSPRRLASRCMGVASMLPNARFEVVDARPGSNELDVADLGNRITTFLVDPTV